MMMEKSKLLEVFRKQQSVDVLTGWQGPHLYDNGLALAYITGSNDLHITGKISAEIIGVETGDRVTIFGYDIFVEYDEDNDEWHLYSWKKSTPTSCNIIMYRGNDRIGDALLFEVVR
jgi:hypothetical protein